ncbi:MAG: S8 family serine peptidase [Bacteroidota bacterium]
MILRALVAALLLGAAAVPLHAQSLRPAPADLDAAFSALAAEARAEGSVRVIVGLAGDYVAEGKLAAAQSKQAQRATIADRQSEILTALAAPLGVTRFRTVPFVAMTVSPQDLEVLRRSALVVSIEEDVAVPAHEIAPLPLGMMDESTVLIGADDAWAAGYDGTGYEVAILDTGIMSDHPFLDGEVVAEACFSNANGAGGATTLCPGGGTIETGSGSGANCSNATWGSGCDHGTHVAGTAAGKRNVSGAPVGGVAPGADLIALQVFSGFSDAASCSPSSAPCVLSYTSDQSRALEHIYDLVTEEGRNIVAANMSLGGGNRTSTCDSDSRKSIIDNLLSVGVATVISSGNNGYSAATGAPGCISSAVTVGSTTKSDAVSSFSNVAPWMDVFAPGSSIRSSVASGYANYNGTSMAAPHVAGAFAVLQQAFPAESPTDLLSRLTSTGVPISAGSPAADYPRILIDGALSLAPPELAYTPSSLSFALAEGATDTGTITLTNDIAGAAQALSISLAISNYIEPSARGAEAGGVAGKRADCTEGETLGQSGSGSLYTVTAGGFEFGQSFTAPCSGELRSIEPETYVVSANAGTSWSGTLRLYEGDGTSGTELAAVAVSGTNGTTNSRESFTATFATPIEVTSGQSYTWFLDLASGSTSHLLTSSNSYADGTAYYTSSGNPGSTASIGWDLDYNATFGPSTAWISLSSTSASLAPGGSTTITVEVDATDLAQGTHSADLVLTTNDPDAETVTIPVALIVGSSAGSYALSGGPGWRFLSAPSATTVDDLAEMNLVAGVPGYYPTFGVADYGYAAPTLYTGYDGSNWSASAGTGEVLTPGMGFLWYFFDDAFTPSEATTNTSSAVAFPMTLAAPASLHASDVTVPLHADGNRFNMLGNPFADPLDVTDLRTWSGGNRIASRGRVYAWNPEDGSWTFPATTIEPWHGFAVKGKRSAGGRTLTIPMSAASAAGEGEPETPEAGARSLLAFELEGAEAETGRVLRDRALAVAFEDGAEAGTDELDADKLAPMAGAFVSLGVHAGEVLRAYEARPMDAASFEVPLVLQTAGAASEMTLRWREDLDLPANWRVLLRDLRTGDVVDLREQTEYTFTAPPSPSVSVGDGGAPLQAQMSTSSARFALSVDTGRAPTAEEAVTLAAIAPNPARDEATLAWTLAQPETVTLEVVDLLGRVVQTVREGHSEAGAHVARVDANRLAAGVYVVRLQAGEEMRIRRLTVVR